MSVLRLVGNLARIGVIILGVAAAIIAVPTTNDYLDVYDDKVKLLERAGPPRIILVGGSGVAFGLDSRLIGEAFATPTINTGVHAGLGLVFMLEHVTPFVRRGDTVVVVPEYGVLSDGDVVDEGIVTDVILSGRASLGSARTSDLRPVLRGFPDYSLRKLLIDPAIGITRRLHMRDQYAYTRAGFDSRGDEVGHLAASQPRVKLGMVIDPVVVEHTRLLNQFGENVAAVGAHPAVLYPVIARTTYDMNQQALARIAEHLREALTVPSVGVPEDAMQPDELFFDTPNHLNAEGRRRNTLRIIAQLRALGP